MEKRTRSGGHRAAKWIGIGVAIVAAFAAGRATGGVREVDPPERPSFLATVPNITSPLYGSPGTIRTCGLTFESVAVRRASPGIVEANLVVDRDSAMSTFKRSDVTVAAVGSADSLLPEEVRGEDNTMDLGDSPQSIVLYFALPQDGRAYVLKCGGVAAIWTGYL